MEHDDQTSPRTDRLQRRDWWMLGGYCLVLFGCCLVSGRGLSIHEAVLPQSAREMLRDGDWLVPKRGGSPWLESPPLPQWVTASLAAPFGACDHESIARLGAVFMGLVITGLVAWMASVWFGRNTGLLAGFVMATTAQFTRYTWLAEDEIFLCGVVTMAVALFVKLEFDRDFEKDFPHRPERILGWFKSFFAGRSAWVLALFLVIGMTNLAKGFIFGTAMAVIPMAGYLLLQGNLDRIRRYVWFWGWLAFVGVAVAWPLAVLARYPDAWEVWWTDLGGRVSGGYAPSVEPIWYYPQNLLWMLAPWTPAVFLGMALTAKTARSGKTSPERFLWCWAILVPLVFSIPQGKNHHYLLHALAPWTILGTLGLIRMYAWLREIPALFKNPWGSMAIFSPPVMAGVIYFREGIVGPTWFPYFLAGMVPVFLWMWNWGLQHRNQRFSAGVLFSLVGVCYLLMHVTAGQFADKHRHDVAFLKTVNKECGNQIPLLVDLDVDALRAFLCLFYLPDHADPLHNLSFLNDDEFAGRDVYLLTRERKIAEAPQIYRWRLVSQSPHTGGETAPEDRLSLFRCTLRDDATGLSRDSVRISPMQSMFRTPGPVLQ